MAKTMKEIGTNIEYSLDGDKLTLVIDISKKGEESHSGKTLIIASTQGNKRLGDVFLGLNVYKYPDKKKGK